MDIYEAENEFYGLIGRPKITAVQPYSSSSTNTKDIVIHFNDDNYGTEQDDQQSNEQSDESNDRKIFKREPNDENYMRGNFVDLNFGVENGTKKNIVHSSTVPNDQVNSVGSFYPGNNVSTGGLVFNVANLVGQNTYKQYQILQERGDAATQHTNNIPIVKFENNQLINGQQQTRFNATTGAYVNRLINNNAYQNTAIDSHNSQLMDNNSSNNDGTNSNNGFQQQFENQMLRTQSSSFNHVANGIYQTSNQDFQGHHVLVKTEEHNDDENQSETVINNVENTKQEHRDDLKGNEGDKPLEPEMDVEGKGSVVCPICGVTYSKYYFNLKHRFFHSGKKYDCSICGRSFNHQHNMYRHKRVHEDINDYQFRCEEDNCEMVFKTQTGLKRHMQMKHSISVTGNMDAHYTPSNFKQVNPATPAKKKRRRKKGSDVETVPVNTTPSSATIPNLHTPNAISNNFQPPQQMFNPGNNGPQVSVQSQIIHGSQPQMSGNPSQISGNPNQISGNPNQMSGNPNQMSVNTNQLSGNPNQMTGNPIRMTDNLVQMGGGNQNQMNVGNLNQIGGNPNQMNVGNSNHMGGNPNQMSNSPQLTALIDSSKAIQQQFFNSNQMEPPYSIGQTPALSLPQNSYNNNNNNKNYDDLKLVSTSQPLTSVPVTSVHMSTDNFNQTYQDSSMIQLVPRVPVLPQNPPAYVNLDQPYPNQGYVSNDKQNVERMSPYTDYQMPPQPETNLKQENISSLEEKKTFSANNGNKTTAVTCHICDKDFSVHYIREHLDHHAGRRYTCYICGMVFLSRDRLKRHKNQHTNKNDYDPYCVRCKLYFPSEKKLAFHIRKVHDGEQMKSSRILQREGAKKKKAMLDQDSDPSALSQDIQNSNDILVSGLVTVDLERKIQVGKKFYFKCKYCNGCFKSKRNRNKHELMHEELAVHSNNLGQNIPNPIMPEFSTDELEQQKLMEEGHLENNGKNENIDYIHSGSESINVKQEKMNFSEDDYHSNEMEPNSMYSSVKDEYPDGMIEQDQNNVHSVKHEFQSDVLSHGNMNSIDSTNHNIIHSNDAIPSHNVIPHELPSHSYPNGHINVMSMLPSNSTENNLQNDLKKNNENINDNSSSSSKGLPEESTTNNNNTMKKISYINNDTNENSIDKTQPPSNNEDCKNEDEVQNDMHKCPYCDSVFKKQVVLNRHISLHLKKTNQ